jgi:hypothetical protein
MAYFVLIGDLVASRELDNRAEVQSRFQDAIAFLNRTIGDQLTAPLGLTAGDEVQGLTREPQVFVDIITHTSESLAPVELSWGVGFGDLATSLADDVASLDGPCFHRAREAVDLAKKRSSSLAVRGIEEPDGKMLSGIMNLIGSIRSAWTERQLEVVRKSRGKMQKDVASSLNVEPSTISRTLALAHYRPVLEGEAAARTLLATLAEEAAHPPTPHRR